MGQYTLDFENNAMFLFQWFTIELSAYIQGIERIECIYTNVHTRKIQ